VVVTIGGITELALVLHMIEPRQIMAVALLVLGGVLIVVAEALWYADISSQILDGRQIASNHVVTYGSLLLFLFSAFVSAASVKISAGAR
jgi:uncharacterized membrane protein YidH (DUF202 family)